MTRSRGEVSFSILNYFLLSGFGFLCLYPFLDVIAQSFSSEVAISNNWVTLLPVQFTIIAYKAALLNAGLVSSLIFTIKVTILGTATNLLLSVLGAYPLSKKSLIGRKFIWIFILVTMFLNGGLIPTFLLVKSLGLLNNIWALILPGAISTFNLIVIKSSFQSIPDSLGESALLDGCTDFGVLFRIILPLSKPILAAMTLFYAVGHWNDFMDPLIYMNDPSKYTLQLFLQNIIPTDPNLLGLEGNKMVELPVQSLREAAIVIATLPIVIVYPWLQRFFIKGMLIGSVKE